MGEYHPHIKKYRFGQCDWFHRACAMTNEDWEHLKRGDRTRLLSDLLVKQVFRYPDPRSYWAREVTVNHTPMLTPSGEYVRYRDVRVDFMRVNNVTISDPDPVCEADIDCFEVKSSVGDLHSGHGLNFIGTRNYVVCPPFLVDDARKAIEPGIGIYTVVHEYEDSGVVWNEFKQVRHAERRQMGLDMKSKLLLCMMRCNGRDMLQYVEYDNPLVEYEEE